MKRASPSNILFGTEFGENEIRLCGEDVRADCQDPSARDEGYRHRIIILWLIEIEDN